MAGTASIELMVTAFLYGHTRQDHTCVASSLRLAPPALPNYLLHCLIFYLLHLQLPLIHNSSREPLLRLCSPFRRYTVRDADPRDALPEQIGVDQLPFDPSMEFLLHTKHFASSATG